MVNFSFRPRNEGTWATFVNMAQANGVSVNALVNMAITEFVTARLPSPAPDGTVQGK